MTDADKIVSHLLETEEPDYLETEQEVRPATSARLDADYREVFKREPTDDTGYSIGSTHYARRGGKWFREIRRKNPAYWDQSNYFIIYPGPEQFAFIACKCPRRITQKIFQKAVFQVFRDATGLPATHDHFSGVDGTEEGVFNRCVGGERPEPAYEIALDGTWKRLK